MLRNALVFALVGLSGCTGESNAPDTAGEALGKAVRDAGFTCDGAASSEIVGERGEAWRVTCANAQVYLASQEADGDLCVEPVHFVDGLGGGPVIFPEARCVSGVTF